MEEEKTLDIVVQEYEQKLVEQKEMYETKIKEQDEKHAKEIRAILSGQNLNLEKPTEEDEEKDFYTVEIEKTKKNLKLE